jgi:hypothetical protein
MGKRARGGAGSKFQAAGLAVLAWSLHAACVTTLEPTQPLRAPDSPPSPAPFSPDMNGPGSPVTRDNWTLIGSARDASVDWAPDARHLLVMLRSTNEPLDRQQVLLATSAGAVVRSYQADAGFWLDEMRFVLFAYPRLPSGETRVPEADEGAIGSLSSEDLVPVEIPAESVSNEDGLVAFSLGSPCARQQFQVWSSSSLSEPREGAAEGWSPDGRLLVVWHYIANCGPESVGWLEVIDWTTGKSLLADPDIRTGIGGALLDRAGRRLVFVDRINKVADLQTGEVVTIDFEDFSRFRAWDGSGHLVLTNLDGDAAAFSSEGRVVERWPAVGDGVTSAIDGSVIGFWFTDTPRPSNDVTLLREASVSVLAMPEDNCPTVDLSPDGMGIAVVCLSGHSQFVYIAPVSAVP